jgi:hypothetical protein
MIKKIIGIGIVVLLVGCGSKGEISWNRSNDTLFVNGKGLIADRYGRMPWYSFRDSITTVVIGEGITRIGCTVFSDHTNLTTIVIPSTIEWIDYDALLDCRKLEWMVLRGKTIPFWAGRSLIPGGYGYE